jgi:4-hydroxy 2-oxovalerate aldolase/long-chain acyl-CoA synthetase
MGIVKRFATKHRVDPRKLIVAVCEHDRINAPENLVEEMALKLSEEGQKGSWKSLYKHYYGKEQS